LNNRRWLPVLVLCMAISFSGCAKGVGGQGMDSVGSMPVPSQVEVGLDSALQSQDSSSSEEESGGSSSEESAASTAAKAYSTKAEANLNSGIYRIKTETYSYQKDNLNYSAEYPQLVSDTIRSNQVNQLLKNCAMQTIRTLGTAKRPETILVRCTGDVTYEGKNFISVGFNEYEKLSPKAETTHTMRTLNFDLKTGKTVGFSDLIQKGDAFYAALLDAGKSQLDADQAAVLDVSTIRQGLDSNVIYFTDESVGFCVRVVRPEVKLVRITLAFSKVKPFLIANSVWDNFI